VGNSETVPRTEGIRMGIAIRATTVPQAQEPESQTFPRTTNKILTNILLRVDNDKWLPRRTLER
jgi:hypothetical protein